VPIAGLALIPLAFGLVPIFLPLQIAYLKPVRDPMCSIVVEAESADGDATWGPPRHWEPLPFCLGISGAASLKAPLCLPSSLACSYWRCARNFRNKTPAR
jgi:Ca2+-transporting ATPase